MEAVRKYVLEKKDKVVLFTEEELAKGLYDAGLIPTPNPKCLDGIIPNDLRIDNITSEIKVRKNRIK